MVDINESIKSNYKLNKSETIRLYESTANKSELNKWSYIYVVNAYISIKEYNKAYTSILEYEKLFKDSNTFIQKKCRAIFNIFVLNSTDEEQMFKAIDFVIKNDIRDQYAVYDKAALVAVDYLFKKSTIVNHQKALKYIMEVDPLTIDDSDEWMKEYENSKLLKTKREKFLGRKIKTLYNLKQYQECLESISDAKNSIKKFHGQGIEWLYYREASCYLELDNVDKAIEVIENNLKNFNHWCKYELLYRSCKQQGDKSKAIKYLSLAARLDSNHKGRVGLYKDAGKYLLSINENEIAYYHLKLVALNKEKEGWKEDAEVKMIINDKEVNTIDERSVLNKLNKYWESSILKDEKIYQGIINNVMGDGKTGFIKDTEGNSYYFNKLSFRKRVYELNIGAKVEFIVTKSFDKKKGRESLVAQQILIK